MKKLLGIVVLSLLLSGNAYAETTKKGFTIESAEDYCLMVGHQKGDDNFKRCVSSKLEASKSLATQKVSSSENKILNTNKDNSLPASKKICLELGFTSGTEKFGDCVLKIMSMSNSENEPTKEVASTTDTTQDKQYNSKPNFPRVEKNKFYYKQLNKYSKMPEPELCISYINAYGWHKREIKQAIKYEVLETRSINCDRYMDVAYYDKQRRSNEIADATKKAFDSGVDAAYGVTPESQRGNKMVCTTQRIGSSGMAKTTCRQK